MMQKNNICDGCGRVDETTSSGVKRCHLFSCKKEKRCHVNCDCDWEYICFCYVFLTLFFTMLFVLGGLIIYYAIYFLSGGNYVRMVDNNKIMFVDSNVSTMMPIILNSTRYLR